MIKWNGICSLSLSLSLSFLAFPPPFPPPLRLIVPTFLVFIDSLRRRRNTDRWMLKLSPESARNCHSNKPQWLFLLRLSLIIHRSCLSGWNVNSGIDSATRLFKWAGSDGHRFRFKTPQNEKKKNRSSKHCMPIKKQRNTIADRWIQTIHYRPASIQTERSPVSGWNPKF